MSLPSESAGRADDAVLRRIERLALSFAAVAAAVALVAVGARIALALTLGSAVAILSFRGLGSLVSRLVARAAGGPVSTLRVIFRFAILALLPVLALWLDTRQFLAFLIGFSAIPLALVTEGALQLLATLKAE